MAAVTVLADLAGRHTPHDVYDLWVESRPDGVLFGWQTADGAQMTFCPEHRGSLHPVLVPWSAEEAVARWSEARHAGRCLRVAHELGGRGPSEFRRSLPARR